MTCIGHDEPVAEDWTRLKQRYGDDTIGFVAELAKKNDERKLMHAILTDAGIASETPQGRGLCLVARLAMLAEKVAQ
jgi:hypothetical protein